MSYRDHKDLVHTWIHQWTDEEENEKEKDRLSLCIVLRALPSGVFNAKLDSDSMYTATC